MAVKLLEFVCMINSLQSPHVNCDCFWDTLSVEVLDKAIL